MGKILFQANLINKSYRNRGSVERAHTQKKINTTVISWLRGFLGSHPNPINALNPLKKKILAYSAIKIMANPPEPYSILNPETSSDSPSEKSKGVRLVSARQETIQNIINIGAKTTKEI